jgi:hypothetical protein
LKGELDEQPEQDDQSSSTMAQESTEEEETFSTSNTTDGLWAYFDEKVAQASSYRTTQTDSFVEVSRYFEERNINRKDNPLQWWKENGMRFPKLQVLARKYLAIPGSSVASERFFSKAGELVSEKRNRIKPKNIDMMLFLNKT